MTARFSLLVARLAALVAGVVWAALVGVHAYAFAWSLYRHNVDAAHALPSASTSPWENPVPHVSDVLGIALFSGAVIAAVAFLGVQLVRSGHRTAGVAAPIALALIPAMWQSSLAGGVLGPTDPSAAFPGYLPYAEALLQAAVVALPAAVARFAPRTTSALPRSAMAACVLAAIPVAFVAGVMTDGMPLDDSALGHAALLAVVVVATGMAAASARSARVPLAIATVVLTALNEAAAGNWYASGSLTIEPGRALGFLAVLSIGPAAALLGPAAARVCRRALRRTDAIQPAA